MARLNGTRECLRNFAAFPGPKLCPFICHSGGHHCESGQAQKLLPIHADMSCQRSRTNLRSGEEALILDIAVILAKL